MTTPAADNQIPAVEQRMLAQVLLAAFDGDRSACDQAEAEIEHTTGGWKGAFAALGAAYVNLLILTAGSEEKARAGAGHGCADASLHEGDG